MITEVLLFLCIGLLGFLWLALGAVIHWLFSWRGVDWIGDTNGAQLMRCLDDARFWVLISLVLATAALTWLVA